MPSLFDMPEVVMNAISEKLGFQSILTLRKVSHNLRDYIDNTSSQLVMRTVDITVDSIRVIVVWTSDMNSVRIEYLKHENGFSLLIDEKEKIVQNVNFITGFCNDFDIIMRHQKSILHRFHLSFFRSIHEDVDVKICDGLLSILKKRPLRAEHFDMSVRRHSGIMSIFPYIDVKFLRRITLSDSTFFKNKLELENIVNLDQWKKAKEICIQDCVVSSSMGNFTHFSKANVLFEKIYLEDLNLLKEACLQSPNFKEFILNYKTFDDVGKLNEIFGSPFLHEDSTGDKQKQWFFKIPNKEDFLEIVLSSFSTISFSVLELSSVPHNYFI